MAAYIVGMIAGATCMIAPLIYWAHINTCKAKILSSNPDVLDRFVAKTSTRLISAIVIIGAVVFLLSAAMAAWTGMARVKASQAEVQAVVLPAAEKPEALDD